MAQYNPAVLSNSAAVRPQRLMNSAMETAPPMNGSRGIQSPAVRTGVTGSNTGAANQNVTRPPPMNVRGRPGASGVAGGTMPGGAQFGQFQDYTDAAMADRMRTLQPQMDQNRDRMAQSLVGRGFQPGSAAYDSEMNRLERMNNDAQNSAHFGSMQFGLGAQGQAFNQQNAMDQLATSLAMNNANNQTQMGISNNNLAQNRDQFNQNFGEGQRRFDLGFGEGQRQFDSNDAFRNDNMDFGQMMGLEGLQYRDSRDAVGDSRYNDQLTLSLLGLSPGFGGGQLDVQGAFGQGANNAWNQYNGQMQQSQNNMAGLGNALTTGLALFSDERLKQNIEHVDTVDGVNVYEFDYTYKPGRFRGVMAQEVAETHPESVSVADNGYMMVDYSKLPVDMVTV